VDGGEAAADGRRHRAFEPDLGPLERFRQLVWDVLVELFISFRAGREALPFELHAGRFQDAHHRADHLWTDAVTRDERYFVRHRYFAFAVALSFSRSLSSFMNSFTSLKSM